MYLIEANGKEQKYRIYKFRHFRFFDNSLLRFSTDQPLAIKKKTPRNDPSNCTLKERKERKKIKIAKQSDKVSTLSATRHSRTSWQRSRIIVVYAVVSRRVSASLRCSEPNSQRWRGDEATSPLASLQRPRLFRPACFYRVVYTLYTLFFALTTMRRVWLARYPASPGNIYLYLRPFFAQPYKGPRSEKCLAFKRARPVFVTRLPDRARDSGYVSPGQSSTLVVPRAGILIALCED